MTAILELIRTPQLIGVFVTFIGGIITRIIEQRLRSKKNTVVIEHLDDGAVIRNELRKDLDSIHSDLEHARRDADEWREKYWKEVFERIEGHDTPELHPPKRHRGEK